MSNPSQTTLVIIGTIMVLTFMGLIMTKRVTPMVALTLVPVAFGLLAGAGMNIGTYSVTALKSMSTTVALLFFAIIFFGLMIDVGLFDPLVRFILRMVKDDPVRLVVGTAVLAAVVSLDGDGSTTFIIVTSALLPLYHKLGLSPVVLTCVAGLANGAMNIVPWGGPTARASVALQVDANDIFVPMAPSMAAGVLLVLLFAWHLGVMERKRIGALVYAGSGTGYFKKNEGSGDTALATGGPRDGHGRTGDAGIGTDGPPSADEDKLDHVGEFVEGLDPNRATLRPKLLWFNALLTVVVLTVLILDKLPLYFVFLVGGCIGMIVNFPKVKDQSEAIVRHASSIVPVVSMVVAVSVLIGVFDGTGMVKAMANAIVDVVPPSMGPWFAVIAGILSLPFTFFLTNDAFYPTILKVMAEAATQYGIDPVEMGRASIVGQPLHLQSPLVPAILLLVTLAGVPLAEHHKKVIWRACLVSLLMLLVGILTGAVPTGF